VHHDDSPAALALPSGLAISEPLERLRRFSGEYPYYDGIPMGNPNEIEPLDVIVTVSVNSFINTADKIRRVHLAMSEACREPLRRIPSDADLLDVDDSLLRAIRDLLCEAMRARGVLVASATKVLHRKRPRLIPMLDSVVLRHYLSGPERGPLLARTIEKVSAESAADAAMVALDGFRSDLAAAAPGLSMLREALSNDGFDLSMVRILDILVWTEVEPRGAYRVGAGATGQV
jgi:hypothetical protein